MNLFKPKGRLKEVTTPITNTEFGGLRLILCPFNLAGKVDGTVYADLDKKWKRNKEELKGWAANQTTFRLGNINAVAVQSDTWIVQMLCFDKEQKLDERALDSCLKSIIKMAKAETGSSVHLSKALLDFFPSLDWHQQFLAEGMNVVLYG